MGKNKNVRSSISLSISFLMNALVRVSMELADAFERIGANMDDDKGYDKTVCV